MNDKTQMFLHFVTILSFISDKYLYRLFLFLSSFKESYPVSSNNKALYV